MRIQRSAFITSFIYRFLPHVFCRPGEAAFGEMVRVRLEAGKWSYVMGKQERSAYCFPCPVR